MENRLNCYLPPPNELIIIGLDAGGIDGGGAYCDCRFVLISKERMTY